jgi:hypothetical protein
LLAVNACCDVDRLIDVCEFNIPESDILDVAIARISFDPSCVTAVREMDVFE